MSRSSRRIRALTLGVIAILLFGASSIPGQALGRKNGLRFLGALKLPRPLNEIDDGYIVHVDAATKRMYYFYKNGVAGGASFLAEYDLRPRLPRLIREREVAAPNALPGIPSPYEADVDTKRGLLLMNFPTVVGNHSIAVVDLKKFKTKASWSLASRVPGFLPYGLTYSRADDRVYLIGDFTSVYSAQQSTGGRKPVAPGTSVVALEAGSGDLAWIRPIPQCQQVLTSSTSGAMIARSRLRSALYFVCVTGGSGAGDSFPGQSGVVRLPVSKKNTQEEAMQAPLEFFPVSGVYSKGNGNGGIAGFDPGTDRLFLQSLSTTTPGAWVFDGRLSSWVGFVAAPNDINFWLGINEVSGRYYMGSGGNGTSQKPWLLVTDGRATPIPQGVVLDLDVDGFIPTDPTQRRIFVPVNPPIGKDEGSRWYVFRDEVPRSQPQRPPDYDALTSNLPEGPKTVTSFSGGVNGYGTRAVLVGGYQGALNYAGQFVSLSQLRAADRGLTAARVPSLDLREVGASASAQALVPDSSTEAELNEAGAGDWPWTSSTCLDGGGQRVEQSSSDKGGATTVKCDLGKGRAEASSSFGAISGDGFSIGSSSFESRAYRDAKNGIITETRSIARAIELEPPNGYNVSIARVLAEAKTKAHGHSGTADVRWRRVLSGVEITDDKGEVVQRFGECISDAKEDACKDAAREINGALGSRLRFDLPDPDLIETKKGAFAAVQQSNADFYNGRVAYSQGTAFAQEAESRAVPAVQLVVYNDSVERSRLLVQLAAIQANSIYTITPREEIEIPKAPVIDDTPDAPSVPEPNVGDTSFGEAPKIGGTSEPAAPIAAVPVAEPVTIPEVLAFLVRSPKEALLVAGIWLLFGGAAGAVVRRRLLVGVLGGNG